MSYIIGFNKLLRTIFAWVLYKGLARAIALIAMVFGLLSMAVAVLGVWMHPTPLDLVPAGLEDDQDIE